MRRIVKEGPAGRVLTNQRVRGTRVPKDGVRPDPERARREREAMYDGAEEVREP